MNMTPKAKEILAFFEKMHQEDKFFRTMDVAKNTDCTLATVHKWIREFKYSGIVVIDYFNDTKRHKDGIYKVKSINLSI